MTDNSIVPQMRGHQNKTGCKMRMVMECVGWVGDQMNDQINDSLLKAKG